MNGSRYFAVVLVLLGLIFTAPVSCIFSPEQSPEAQKGEQYASQEGITADESDVPVGQAIICESSEEVFTKIMRSDTTLILMAEPVSDEEAPEIHYRYELLDENENCIEAGYFRVINPRLEEEMMAETESMEPKLSATSALVGWDGTRYTGRSVRYTNSVSNLGSWNNKISSCMFNCRGYIWIMYTNKYYRGNTLYVKHHLPWLPRYMDNNAESIRKRRVYSNTDLIVRPYNPFSR